MGRDYEAREVTHGVSFGAFAKIKAATSTGKLDTTIEPAIFTGLRGVSFDTTQDMSSYYADNVVHVKVRGNKKVEGSIKAYQIPRAFLVEHLGFKEVAATGALLDTGSAANFIWQYIETVVDEFGVEVEQLTIYYNCTAGAPTAESKTDEESTDPKEFEIPVTASPNSLVLDEDGKAVTYLQIRKTTANANLFALAYTAIILPDTAVPPTV